mmetsp:Transcript_18341/g.45453  ORF Transcript_18341/g.45453 Transcript_18341/m.45453 type:complete len:691 (-) Transcript_18341:125-2197(-)
MSEMDNLSLSGGRRRNHAPRRRGPIGALDRRQALRNSLRRSNRSLMRRLRGGKGGGVGKDSDEPPEGESLITTTTGNGRGGFRDGGDAHGDGAEYDKQESKPINEIDSDDNDDFLDSEEYHNDDADNDDDDKNAKHHDDKEDETPTGDKDEKVNGDHAKGSDSKEDHTDESENDDNGQWGRYDDEYENRSTDDDSLDIGNGDYKDNGGGSYRDGEDFQNGGSGGVYNDGDYRIDVGSPRSNGGKRHSTGGIVGGRRSGLLKQLSKNFRRRGRKSTSNLDHTNLLAISSNSIADPYWSPSTPPPPGRIEGFGSTKPDFASPRTLRQKLKDFRDNRIAAGGKDDDDGMIKMEVGGGDPKKKNWKERIDNVVDAMVDASLPEPELQGYMSSVSRTVTTTQNKSSSSSTPTPPPTPTDLSRMSYERKQFGDDNAYIVYLEGEKVAHELELLSYRNRIQELESEARKLKGKEGGNGGDNSTAPSDSSNAGDEGGGTEEKESEIEWQTGVPEEGVLIDIGESPQAPTFNKQRTAAVPVADLLQSPPAPTTSNEQSTAVAPVADLLQTQTEGQIEEKPSQTSEVAAAPNDAQLLSSQVEQIQQENVPGEASKKETTTEQKEDTLVDLSVRDEAKDIVDNILADLLNEKKVTSLLADDDEEDVVESLLSLKLDQSENAAAPEAQNTASDSARECPWGG